MAYSIHFFGNDYSKISDVSSAPRPEFFETNLGVSFDYDKILNKFIDILDESELDGIFINFSNERQKTNSSNKRIRAEFNAELFGGLVGVIRKRIVLTAQDCLIDYTDINEVESEHKYEFDITLQITSRFDSDNHPYFLATMLQQAYPRTSLNYIESSKDNFFDFLLIYIYKTRLIKSYEKGYFRTYSTFERNDSHIRGSIDIAKHIKLNLGLQNGKIAYRYREKSVDNYLNHLILEAYDVLKRRFPENIYSAIESDYELRSIIQGLRYSIGYPKYDKRTLLQKNDSIIAHPYYLEYEELRKVCLSILKYDGVSIFDGFGEDVEGLVFYIPDLWELYVKNLLSDAIKDVPEISLSSQHKTEIFGQEQPGKLNYTKTVYPDFVFCYQQNETQMPFMVLDAKFKKSWGDWVSKEKSIASKDLADYDKCIRDMNSLNAHATGTIFPSNNAEFAIDETDGAEGFKLDSLIKALPTAIVKHKISKYNHLDVFYTIPVFIPLAEGGLTQYDKWCDALNDYGKAIINQINNWLQEEKKYFKSLEIKNADR